MSKKLYFAGDLFDHKHLIGNALLARSLEYVSNNEIQPLLPQNHEQTDFRAVAIRNQDLAMVIESDLALFNFDGTDLDSGTVVEFMFTKFLDIPSVILRTDFRNAGDGLKDGDPWNLMATGYPRTENVILNAMVGYQEELKRDLERESEHRGIDNVVAYYTDAIARRVCFSFENLLSSKKVINPSKLLTKYINAIESAGDGFEIFLKKRWNLADTTLESYLETLIQSKIDKGIY